MRCSTSIDSQDHSLHTEKCTCSRLSDTCSLILRDLNKTADNSAIMLDYIKKMEDNSRAILDNVDKKNQQDYNSIKNVHKEEQVMSFGGIVFLRNMITGFADRKSSFGKAVDPDREEVQKLFYTDNFVMAMTGANQIRKVSNGVIQKIWLEDWLKNHISNYSSPVNLCTDLWDFARDSSEIALGTVYVAIGFFPESCPYPALLHIEFNNEIFNIKYFEKKYFDAFYCGANEFVQYFDADKNKLYGSEENIRKALQESYEIINPKLGYNPVGNTWDIHSIVRC